MASLINFIKGLVTIARFLPELFSAISKLVKMITDAIDDAERKKANDKFNDALNEAKKTKDTSKVEDMFDPKPKTQSLFSLRVIDPVKPDVVEKKSIDLSKGNMGISFMSASSSVIIDPTVSPTTPRNVSSLGSGMGGGMGSKFVGIAILLSLLSCRSTDKLPGENAPSYKPEIFAGDSANGGITRAQSNQFISAQDPEFDNYFAVHANTMSCIFQTYVNNCERFKKQRVDCKPVEMNEIKAKIERIEAP